MASPSKYSSARVALRRIVHVVIDRPLGSAHPEHSDIVYELNYGFVPDVMGGDGEAQDAYVLGVDEPISEFDGVVIAVIHRLDDNEDKWVVAPSGYQATDEEIIEKTMFQEKYFKTELIR
ncbi:MAG: inorganic pyrophosphatase [Clostridiales bacterium]|nr:inorganic pyrophosphatase [Clostridiales bacterium]